MRSPACTSVLRRCRREATFSQTDLDSRPAGLPMHEQLGQIHHVETPPAHHRSRPGHQSAGGEREPRAGPTRRRRAVVPMGNYVTNQGGELRDQQPAQPGPLTSLVTTSRRSLMKSWPGHFLWLIYASATAGPVWVPCFPGSVAFSGGPLLIRLRSAAAFGCVASG